MWFIGLVLIALTSTLGLLATVVLRRVSAQRAGREIRLAVAQGALLVDVRRPHEFADGHLPNALNVPNERVAFFMVQQFDRPIVLYSGDGRRSKKVKNLLSQLGATQVYDLGAIANYDRLGLPRPVDKRAEPKAANPRKHFDVRTGWSPTMR